jgi:hypothetical protein
MYVVVFTCIHCSLHVHVCLHVHCELHVQWFLC